MGLIKLRIAMEHTYGVNLNMYDVEKDLNLISTSSKYKIPPLKR